MTFKLPRRSASRSAAAPGDFAFLESAAAEEAADRRNLKWALGAAVLFHLLLFLVRFPSWQEPLQVGKAGATQKVYVVRQARFRPPRTAPQHQIPERRKKKIPIPDPTPDEPEPIRDVDVTVPQPDLDLPPGPVTFDIPVGPPGAGELLGAVDVGGDVLPPVKINAPRPRYTEEARQNRVQGFVILQAVIDRGGKVASVEVIKGLPDGLDKSAVEAVQQWTFKPATRNGVPVAVYFNLTVSFTLQ